MTGIEMVRLEDSISVEILKVMDEDWTDIPRTDLQGIAEAKAKEIINIVGKALKNNG